jgi:hypothetical protein
MQATTKITIQFAAATTLLALLMSTTGLLMTQKVRVVTPLRQPLESLFSEVESSEVSSYGQVNSESGAIDPMRRQFGADPGRPAVPMPPRPNASDPFLEAVTPETMEAGGPAVTSLRHIATRNDRMRFHPPGGFDMHDRPMRGYFSGEIDPPPPSERPPRSFSNAFRDPDTLN